MANQDADLYVEPGAVLEAHEPARLLSETELTGCCRDATRRLQRRGYLYGFRDVTPFWVFAFQSTGRNLVTLPRTPVLSIVKVETVWAGIVTEQDLAAFFIDEKDLGRIGSAVGFGNGWADSDTARLLHEGNPSVPGLSDRGQWLVTYTGGTVLTDEASDVALQLAKVRVDEIRAVAAGGEFATSDRFTQARDRLLADWPQKAGL